MARHKDRPDAEHATRHPLLVYYNLGRRYRPPALLLVLMGLLSFTPSFIEELQYDNMVEPEALAIVGGVLMLVGAAMWLFTVLATHHSYVEARADVLVVRGPFTRTLVSYRRVKLVQPVQVSQLYPKKALKGIGRPLMTPLLAMTAVELHMRSWPAPKSQLVRRYGRYLFSPRTEAWLFVVPAYNVLIRQIDAALQRKAEHDRGGTAYEDPIERLRYYSDVG